MRRASDPRGGGTSAWITAVRERRFNTATEKLMMMVLCDYIDATDETYVGQITLSEDVGVNVKTITRSIDRLESEGVIRRTQRPIREGSGGRGVDAIEFLWEGFQGLPLVRGDEGPSTGGSKDILSGRQQGGQRTINRGVEGHLGSPSSFRTPLEPPSSRKRARPSSFPASFRITDAMALWATENVPGLDLRYETSQFADYWRGREDVKRTDWVASWRTWTRKAQKDSETKKARTNGHRETKPSANNPFPVVSDWQS